MELFSKHIWLGDKNFCLQSCKLNITSSRIQNVMYWQNISSLKELNCHQNEFYLVSALMSVMYLENGDHLKFKICNIFLRFVICRKFCPYDRWKLHVTFLIEYLRCTLCPLCTGCLTHAEVNIRTCHSQAREARFGIQVSSVPHSQQFDAYWKGELLNIHLWSVN